MPTRILVGGVLLLAAITIGGLVWIPHWWVGRFAAVDAKDRPKLEDDYRRTMAQLLGGLALLAGLFFAYQQFTGTQQQLRFAQQQAAASEQGQSTDRFSKAVAQLGSDSIESRLGGIYALERLAQDSPRDHWPVMEVLTAYVRQHAPVRPDMLAAADPSDTVPAASRAGPTASVPAPDIQAVMHVLRWRISAREQVAQGQRLDLHLTDLGGVDLESAHLLGADLSKTNLSGAYLHNTVLGGALLRDADLSGALLDYADLRGAHLHGANLRGAHLRGTDLSGADLSGADLTGVAGLLQAQLENTLGDPETKLPGGIEPPAAWSHALQSTPAPDASPPPIASPTPVASSTPDASPPPDASSPLSMSVGCHFC